MAKAAGRIIIELHVHRWTRYPESPRCVTTVKSFLIHNRGRRATISGPWHRRYHGRVERWSFPRSSSSFEYRRHPPDPDFPHFSPARDKLKASARLLREAGRQSRASCSRHQAREDRHPCVVLCKPGSVLPRTMKFGLQIYVLAYEEGGRQGSCSFSCHRPQLLLPLHTDVTGRHHRAHPIGIWRRQGRDGYAWLIHAHNIITWVSSSAPIAMEQEPSDFWKPL